MDPAALAAAVTALLVPYLVKAGEKLAETIGAKLPENVGKLWNTIATKLKGKPAAAEAVKDLAARPDDADNQAAFRKELKKALEEDASFAAELAQLLPAAQGETLINTGSGAIATHGGVAAGEGGVAVQGDVSGGITVQPPYKPS